MRRFNIILLRIICSFLNDGSFFWWDSLEDRNLLKCYLIEIKLDSSRNVTRLPGPVKVPGRNPAQIGPKLRPGLNLTYIWEMQGMNWQLRCAMLQPIQIYNEEVIPEPVTAVEMQSSFFPHYGPELLEQVGCFLILELKSSSFFHGIPAPGGTRIKFFQ
ncbi:hypothetical protein SUGI_0711410 [Cryptomeria japonica]|nr:hypothetical protein SUGI_0711410 [Cryptomeria japonica]